MADVMEAARIEPAQDSHHRLKSNPQRAGRAFAAKPARDASARHARLLDTSDAAFETVFASLVVSELPAGDTFLKVVKRHDPDGKVEQERR